MKTYLNKRKASFLFLCMAAGAALFSCNKNTNPKLVTTVTTEAVTTDNITSITPSTAVSGGKLNTVGSDYISSGVCWDVQPNPVVTTGQKATTFDKSTNFSLQLTGLSGGITYYVRAYVITISGVTYGDQVKFTTATPPIKIGQSYAGGIIFYVDNTGEHGLVASPNDLTVSTPWENGNYKSITTLFVTDTAVGSGQLNTTYIISKLGTPTGYAAYLCKDYSINGFSDWFLPSRNELLLIKKNLQDKGLISFTAAGYWSSSTATVSSPYAFSQDVLDDAYQLVSIDGTEGVRAVRAF